MMDLSMLFAAQMEEIDSLKELRSSMSTGTRVFKSSTVRVRLELEDGRTDVNSGLRHQSCSRSHLRGGLGIIRLKNNE
jgi:hypothetical protein